VFTGQPTDVSVSAISARRRRRGAGDPDHRGVSFYEGETHRLNPDGTTTKLELPAKSNINAPRPWTDGLHHGPGLTAPSGQEFNRRRHRL
jgi:prolyl oligopeptidase